MGIVFAPAGNLGGELGRHPEGHMFVGSKAPWYAITDHLPQHEVYPPGFPAEGVPRPQVVPREGVTEGSCVCGEVAYEFAGTAADDELPLRALPARAQRGARDERVLQGRRVPLHARRVKGAGVQGAGREVPRRRVLLGLRGKVPRISAERGIVVVPAGSLDTDPGIRPMAHIFVANKAPWFDITDTLPQFAQMPPAPG